MPAPVAAPPTTTPPQGAQVDTQAVPPAADPKDVLAAYPFLGEIASAKIPGVFIPKGWSNPATKIITPQVINSLGLVFSKSKDPSIALAIVNPKAIKRSEFDKLDKEKKLDDHFPSIATFVPSVSGAAASPAADAETASSDAQKPGPSEGPVDVTPMPAGGLGANAQDQIAKARTANLAQQLPSNRQVPGGGTVLNGLLKRAV